MSESMAAMASIAMVLPAPVLLLLAIWKLFSRIRSMPSPSVASGPGFPRRRGFTAGDRVPRRPLPFSGAGAVALELPTDELRDVG